MPFSRGTYILIYYINSTTECNWELLLFIIIVFLLSIHHFMCWFFIFPLFFFFLIFCTPIFFTATNNNDDNIYLIPCNRLTSALYHKSMWHPIFTGTVWLRQMTGFCSVFFVMWHGAVSLTQWINGLFSRHNLCSEQYCTNSSPLAWILSKYG